MNNWQLVVYPEDEAWRLPSENDETTLPLRKYLSIRHEGRVDWNPSLEDSTIILETQGREWLASKWNLGNIGVDWIEGCSLMAHCGRQINVDSCHVGAFRRRRWVVND